MSTGDTTRRRTFKIVKRWHSEPLPPEIGAARHYLISHLVEEMITAYVRLATMMTPYVPVGPDMTMSIIQTLHDCCTSFEDCAQTMRGGKLGGDQICH